MHGITSSPGRPLSVGQQPRRHTRRVASFRESDTRRAATPRTELAFKWPKRLTSTVSFHNKGEKRGEVTERAERS